jgi:glucosamine kinase
MSAQPLVMGVDSGGTKTLVALADRAGHLVHLATAGGTGALDNPGWEAELAALLRDNHGAGVVQAGLGLSAYGEIERVSKRQHALVEATLPCPSLLRNDVEVAFDGAFAGGPGILLLAGTGSMIWAADNTGTALRIGGWGELFGDEGSAYWIGREALARASQALDGRIDGADFAAAILAAIGGGDDASRLLDWAYGLEHRRPAFAGLARAVDQAASTGDPVALALLDEAASHLACHVQTARRRLADGMALPWSRAGSLFNSRILSSLTAGKIGSAPLPARLPPLGGALLDAARAAGWPVDAAWIDRLSRALADARITSHP